MDISENDPNACDTDADGKMPKEGIFVGTLHGDTYCELYGKENMLEESDTQCNSNIVVIVHGLGGSVAQWEESDIAPFLARNRKVVLCFDWYSHGKSTKVNPNEVAHDVGLFITQLHDVINHSSLPFRGKHFHLHGFSMGMACLVLCYIILIVS